MFDDGNFNEFETFLLTDWLTHTPKEVLAKNFDVTEATFDNSAEERAVYFSDGAARRFEEGENRTCGRNRAVPQRFDFRTSEMKPTKVTTGGEVKIIDAKNFPVTTITAAIVTLKPGGLREMHWHPNADEWQYYISGKGRMTVFAAGGRARTMDFEAGDVGYVQQSIRTMSRIQAKDLVFLEMFKATHYEDISLAEWLAHTPPQLVDGHVQFGIDMLKAIEKKEAVIRPM